MKRIFSFSLFLVFALLFQYTHHKNYNFKVIYDCQDNEFQAVGNQHNQLVRYVCKKWVQKILITEIKSQFVKFDSKEKQREDEVDEQEDIWIQKEIQLEQERDKQLSQLKLQMRQERIMREREQRRQRRRQQLSERNNFREETQQDASADKFRQDQQRHGGQIYDQDSSDDYDDEWQDDWEDEPQLSDHSTHRKGMSKTNEKRMYQQTNTFDSSENQQTLKFHQQLRRHNQIIASHKPLINHQYHSPDDIVEVIQVIKMSSAIFENSSLKRQKNLQHSGLERKKTNSQRI